MVENRSLGGGGELLVVIQKKNTKKTKCSVSAEGDELLTNSRERT